MKKQITKHFMAFFLSLVMIMAMGLTAFADETETYTLTVNDTGTTEHIFELYQIFTGGMLRRDTERTARPQVIRG